MDAQSADDEREEEEESVKEKERNEQRARADDPPPPAHAAATINTSSERRCFLTFINGKRQKINMPDGGTERGRKRVGGGGAEEHSYRGRGHDA